MKIKAILWDLDNTLIDFYASEKAALEECFAAFQLPPCTEAQRASYSALNLRWWQRLERGEVTKAQLLPGRFQEFFQKEGIPCTDYKGFNALYQQRLGETVVFLDNAATLLPALKSQVKQYAVTNGTAVAQGKKLKKSGLDQIFDGIFISEQVGAEKPSPLFFQRVLSAIGSYQKEELLLVGDSLTSDMTGGLQADLPCCWYNPKGLPCPPDMDIPYIIHHLDQVRDILAERENG